MEQKATPLETLAGLAKRRGFVFPSSDIYGGISGSYDFGPYGMEMVRKIKDRWWDSFVRQRSDIFGLDSAIIQNPALWQASGHVDGFHDPLVDCLVCQTRHRADQLADTQEQNPTKLDQILKTVACPKCGNVGQYSAVKQFNMMFKTALGPSGDEEKDYAYLRPETAGGIFADFVLVRETTRAKLPFGIAQIGKAFRNEISPRDFLFRVREFEQMEIEYFVHPQTADEQYQKMKQLCWDWLISIGVDESKMQWYQHTAGERAHYAIDSWDINYHYPFGAKELLGVANRSDFDLKAHSKGSGRELTYFDPESNQHLTPYVIEPSLGIGRLFLALMDSAYHEEQVKDELRVVMKFDPKIAPVDVAVLPLSKHDQLSPIAHRIFDSLVAETQLVVEYDETQSIGKRYRRQDEIGTPKCVTVDFESIQDEAVTIRERDSMRQTRVPIKQLSKTIQG